MNFLLAIANPVRFQNYIKINNLLLKETSLEKLGLIKRNVRENTNEGLLTLLLLLLYRIAEVDKIFIFKLFYVK